MNQLEFDKLMNAIRQKKEEANEKLRAELAEIETRRNKASMEYEDARNRYKSVCDEITRKQCELKELNSLFSEQKKVLTKAFPQAYGVRADDNGRSRHKLYALRAKLLDSLKSNLSNSPDIDVENINVHFAQEDGNITFTATIPKADDMEH